MTRIHAVAQHQGAVVAGAARLPSGCWALAALASDVLDAEVISVPVAAGRSSIVDGVANRAELVANRTAQLAALEAPAGPVLTIGGDCAVDIAPIGVARFRYGPDLTVCWFDAHPDLNTPQTSPSGALHGMALRAVLGSGDPEFAASPAVGHGRAVLFGARSIDPGERSAIADGLTGPLADGPRYLHLDLDVLDPAEFDGACCPEPDGWTVADVAARIRELGPFVGAAITECITDDRDRLSVLVPILRALAFTR